MPEVLVVYVPASGIVWQQVVKTSSQLTVEQAIRLSGFAGQHPDIDWQAGGVGIFGKRVQPSDLVFEGDRIEIYRGLVFDPKESRRRRALHRQKRQQTGDKGRGRR